MNILQKSFLGVGLCNIILVNTLTSWAPGRGVHLQLEDASDTVESVNNEVRLLCIILIQKVNEDLQTSAP